MTKQRKLMMKLSLAIVMDEHLGLFVRLKIVITARGCRPIKMVLRMTFDVYLTSWTIVFEAGYEIGYSL